MRSDYSQAVGAKDSHPVLGPGSRYLLLDLSPRLPRLSESGRNDHHCCHSCLSTVFHYLRHCLRRSGHDRQVHLFGHVPYTRVAFLTHGALAPRVHKVDSPLALSQNQVSHKSLTDRALPIGSAYQGNCSGIEQWVQVSQQIPRSTAKTCAFLVTLIIDRVGELKSGGEKENCMASSHKGDVRESEASPIFPEMGPYLCYYLSSLVKRGILLECVWHHSGLLCSNVKIGQSTNQSQPRTR